MSAYSEASKAVYRVFDDTTPLVEGLSIDEAFLDVRGMERIAGTPTEIAVRLRRERARTGRPADHGRGREDEVPREGGERRGEARRPARRAARRRARVPPPAPGRAPLGRRAGDRQQAPRPRDHDRRRGRGARRGHARLLLGRASGRHLHALAHNRDPRPVQARRRRRSIGSQRALGRSPRSLAEIDAVARRRSSTASPAGCATPDRRRPHGRAQAALRRLLASDPLAHAAARDRATRRRSSRPREGCSRPRCPLIERQGLTLVGIAVANLDDDARQLVLPFDARSDALDAALDEVRARSARPPSPAPCSSAVLGGVDAAAPRLASPCQANVCSLSSRHATRNRRTRPACGRARRAGSLVGHRGRSAALRDLFDP